MSKLVERDGWKLLNVPFLSLHKGDLMVFDYTEYTDSEAEFVLSFREPNGRVNEFDFKTQDDACEVAELILTKWNR